MSTSFEHERYQYQFQMRKAPLCPLGFMCTRWSSHSLGCNRLPSFFPHSVQRVQHSNLF
eukprot:jgi/Botrbrau1/909/Bobra.0167s0025.1